MIELDVIKADLLSEYKDELCEDSVNAILAATTLDDFISLLHEFSLNLNYKRIPKVDWVRKWFSTTEMKQIANDKGVYFEGVHSVVNPKTPLVVMGDAQIMFNCNAPHVYNIVLQDSSKCSITSFYTCVVKVRQKDNSECAILHKDRLSQVKIRKI